MSLSEEVLRPLKHAASIINLDSSIVDVLSKPERTLIVSIPVRMDNGNLKVFTGYRVQHNTARGPAKGGIRYHLEVSLEEVTSLAYWMAIKNAVIGIPYGGGKGGVTCNPKEMSKGELERLTRGYAAAIARFVGPDKDIPAPDVNTTAQVMGWFADEYYKIKGAHLSSVITSKPLAIGGSKGRDTATGRGVFFTILEAAKAFNIELKGARVSLQGYGNAAQPIARYLHETGCKIVAVSDSTGGAYDSDGMDPKQLVDHKTKNGSVKGFPGSRELSVTDPISVDCDILVPAALENQLTEENASEVKAKLVAEAANGPTTTEADRILHEKGVVVLPDVLANAGGVAVSYFEWVQNRMGYYWSNEEVDDKLRVTMANAFENVHTNMEKYKIDMRTAAYVTAVQKIVDAMRALGRI